jgi:crotonobetainyl-CoA:carnitine CoA-transferase CaiB-like acyl-CoA transferase
VIEALVKGADIVLMSFKPRDRERYGIAYEDFEAINPQIIYLDHVPVGSKGPYGGDPGYDVVVQGMSGTAVITARERGGVPISVRPAYNDMGTGFLSAVGVLAALHHRDQTGEGQRVETSLLSTALTMANQLVTWFAATDPPLEEAFAAEVAVAREQGAGFEEQRQLWEKHYLRGTHGNIYFRHYRTKDGFISVGCLSQSLNARFRAVTGLVDPRQEPDFDLGTPEAYDALTKLIREAEDLLATRTSADWIRDFRAGGVPCGPLNFPPDVFHDEHILANEFVVDMEHEVLGPYKTFGLPIRMDRTPPSIRSSAPVLDAHTDEVLAELGFAGEAITALRSAGVVGRA